MREFSGGYKNGCGQLVIFPDTVSALSFLEDFGTGVDRKGILPIKQWLLIVKGSVVQRVERKFRLTG